MAVDPFTLVYNAIWTMIEDHAEVSPLIKKGNILKYTGAGGDRQIRKPAMSEADVPELRLMTESTEVNIQATSSSTKITERLTLSIRGGSLLYDSVLNPVRWAIIRSCSTWADVLVPLLWNSKAFVVQGLPLSTIQRLLVPKEEQGGKAMWMSILTYQVDMAFDTSDL